MKIMNTATNETVAEIDTNLSMTLDEALELIGAEIINDMDDERWSNDYDNVILDGERYWHDDLELCC